MRQVKTRLYFLISVFTLAGISIPASAHEAGKEGLGKTCEKCAEHAGCKECKSGTCEKCKKGECKACPTEGHHPAHHHGAGNGHQPGHEHSPDHEAMMQKSGTASAPEKGEAPH